MLEQFFSKPDTVDQIRSSWLGEPIERYVVWLSSQDYAPNHIRSRVPILRRFAQFVWSRGGRTFEELPQHIEPFVSDWIATTVTIFGLRSLLEPHRCAPPRRALPGHSQRFRDRSWSGASEASA